MLEKMDTSTKLVLFNVIDTYFQNFKTKQAFAAKYKDYEASGFKYPGQQISILYRTG
jgi:hypothetical protein